MNTTTQDYDLFEMLMAEETGEGYTTIPPRQDQSQAPLSHAQRRLWTICRLHPETAAYHITGVLGLHGDLRREALAKAFDDLVARHDILRTRFEEDDQEALAISDDKVMTPVLECREALPDEAAFMAQLRRAADAPFDLSQGPLLRMILFERAPDHHILLLVIHHIIADAYSLATLTGELGALYTAHLKGSRAELPPVTLQYGDYATWQRENEALMKADLQWWLDQLANPPAPALPTDHPRPAQRSFQGATTRFNIDEMQTARAEDLARGEQTTPYMLFLAIYYMLLYRYSGAADLTVGTPIAGRNHPQLEGMVGFFVNTLVLRAQLNGNTPLRKLLAQVRTLSLEAFARQDVPFERLVQELVPERDLSYNPLFQVAFSLENVPSGKLELPGLSLEPMPLESHNAKFDMLLTLSRTDSYYAAELEYATELFDQTRMENWSQHYCNLLRDACANPDKPLHSLSLLGQTERDHLLDTFNRTASAYPHQTTLAERFDTQVRRDGKALALEFGAVRLTYEELQEEANRLAHALLDMGVRPEEPVGISMAQSCQRIVAVLAILKAGGAYVPLDASYPRQRLEHMVVDCGLNLVLSDRDDNDAFSHIKVFCPNQAQAMLQQQPTNNPPYASGGDQLAYIIFTSGSTGLPKGSAIPQRAVARLVMNNHFYAFGPEDRLAQLSNFSFDAATMEVWGSLLNGGGMIGVDRETLLSPKDFEHFLKAKGITAMFLTSALFNQIVQQLPDAFSDMRCLLAGGEALDPNSIRRVHAARPPAQLLNGYGPTEVTTFALTHDTRGLAANAPSVPIGKPISNTLAYVCDMNLNALPKGIPGELLLGGDGLARSYVNQPALTAASFVPSPFGPSGTRLYRTGDLVRLKDDDTVEYLGRIDQQVKIRGFRIEPGEVESRLKSHEAVEAALVGPFMNERGERRLIAHLIAQPDLDLSTLTSYLTETLPDFCIPSSIIAVPNFPLTANGKVDRAKLLKDHPPVFHREGDGDLIPPETEAEKTLAVIWQDVLSLGEIGRTSDFFEAGGDSILAIQVVNRLLNQGFSLKIRDLFRHRNLRDVAAQMTRAKHQVQRDVVGGSVPYNPIQHWYFENYRNANFFNQSVLLKSQDKLDLKILNKAIAAIWSHHDALRLIFPKDGPAQYRPVDEPPLSQSFSLSSTDEIASYGKQSKSAFSLEEGPLFAVALFQLPHEQRLLLSAHHLIIDAVSWRLLVEDLERAYVLAEQGRRLHLSPKTRAFQAYSEHLQVLAKDEEMNVDRAYWEKALQQRAGLLPRDGACAQNDFFHKQVVHLELNEQETARVFTDIHHAYHTRPTDILLAALSLALEPLCDDGLWIHMEAHGRNLLGDGTLARTVGWFTSLFPFHLKTHHQEPGEVLRHIKEQLRAIPREGAGYGILRYLDQDGEGTSYPEPQLSFNYLGQFQNTKGDSEQSLLIFADEDHGPDVDPSLPRAHDLDMGGMLVDHRLSFWIDYNPKLHNRQFVAALLDRFKSALNRLADHCHSLEHSQKTPSDFSSPAFDLQTWGTFLEKQSYQADQVDDVRYLSPLQEGMLFQARLDPEASAYFVQLDYGIEGTFEEDAAMRAWQRLITRHDVLRTRFAYTGLERPLQIVMKGEETAVYFSDLSAYTPAEQDQEVQAWALNDRQQGFNLEESTPCRLALFRLGPKGTRVLWSYHHLLLDGWCMGIVLRDWLALYREEENGIPAQLPAPVPYSNYIQWLEHFDKESARAFWANYLADFQQPTGPITEPQPRREPGRAAQSFVLDETHSKALKQRSVDLGITLNTMIQGVWARLLALYNQTDDVVFGAVVSGRPAALDRSEEIVGLFINTVPVRVRFPKDMPFSQILSVMQEEALAAEPHHVLPLSEIQAQAPCGNDLFQHIMVFENYPVEDELNKMEHAPFEITDLRAHDQTHYGFDITVLPGKSLTFSFAYQKSHHRAEQVKRMADHFLNLLKSCAYEGDAEVDIRGEAERQLMAGMTYQTEEPVPIKSFAELFAANVKRWPQRTALISGDQHLSYVELASWAASLTKSLEKLNVGPEDRVAICLPRGSAMVAAVLAVQSSGAAHVPLDAYYPEKRLTHMIRDAQVKALITWEDTPLTHVSTETLYIDTDQVLTQERVFKIPRVDPANLAYMVFTSGSTGLPKGTMVSQEAWLNTGLAYWNAFDIGLENWRHLQMAGFSFDVFEGDLIRALGYGDTLVIAPRETVLDAPALFALLEQEAIAFAEFVPAVFRPLADYMEREGKSLPHMRRLIISSDSWDIVEYRRFRQRFGPETHIINSYGVTEAAIDSSSFSDQGIPLEGDRVIPIGTPLSNVRLQVMDTQLRPLPIGVAGELVIGGSSVGRGYWGKPRLTAARFVPDPCSREKGARLYRTGDRARYLSDGQLEFLGRLDHQIKVRGVRIEPGEIEKALMGHPQIKMAVVGLHAGAGEKRLVAWYECIGAAQVTASECRHFLSSQILEAMMPSAFVALQQWPLTGNDKIDRKRLPQPTEADLALETILVPATTKTQVALVNLWQRVLGVERIGIENDFFALGGHSLKAMQITSAIQAEFGVRVPLRTFFADATIAPLATFIDSADQTNQDPIQVAPEADSYPLSHTQSRFYLMHHMGGEKSLNMIDAHVVTAPLEVDLLERVVTQLMERHQILRTGFRKSKGIPSQFIAQGLSVPIQTFDLRGHENADEEARALASHEATQAFSLHLPPLFRLTLIQLADEKYVFILKMHHIIGDGWSDNVLYGEMLTLYNRFKVGDEDPLPEPRVQYKDYACWERARGFDREAALWREIMPVLPEPLALPYDHVPQGNRTFAGGMESLVLGSDIAQPLAEMARQKGILRPHITLSLLKLMLFRLCGQRDITVGLTLANRNHPDLERMVGAFVNILPTQTHIEDHFSFEDLLNEVDRCASRVLDAQAYPFDQLVRDLNPSRDHARQSLFNVVLTYANFEDLNLGTWEQQSSSQGEREIEERFDFGLKTANFDLVFLVNDQGHALSIDLNYDTDLFEPSSIRRFLNLFKSFAALAISQPQAHLSAFPLLEDGEAKDRLRQWSESDQNWDRQVKTIDDAVLRAAQNHPDAVALFDDNQSITYAELVQAAKTLAQDLRQHGLAPEDVVAIRMEPSPQTVIAMLAILLAGGAYLPLDPSLPLERVAFQIEDTAAMFCVYDMTWFSEVFELSQLCPNLQHAFLEEQGLQFSHMPLAGTELPQAQPIQRAPGSLAYVVYTSGSTGKPKGVLVPHAGVLRLCLDPSWQAPAQERFVQAGSLSFDAATLEIWRPLCNGGACGFPDRTTVLDPSNLRRFIQKHQITTMFLTTQLFNRITDDEPQLFESMNQVHTGGEKVSPAHVSQIRHRFPSLKLFHVYGPTENTVYTTRYPVTQVATNDVPIGRPLAGSSTWLLDRHLQPVCEGVIGELCTGGVALTRGYLNRPALTAQVMVPHPFGNGERLYRTGDLARWQADGELVFQGRRDAQVKVRGHRIEPAEVERYLVAQEGVGQAVVRAQKGETGTQLAAWFTLASGHAASDVRAGLKAALPEYMIPTWLVVMDEIPLNANGKVQVSALPDPETYTAHPEAEPPSNETEQILLEAWTTVLNRPNLGVTDNFFDVGGHSLAMVDLSSIISQKLGQAMPLNVIFQHPTVRTQARHFMDQTRFGSELADNSMALLAGEPDQPSVFAFPPGTGDTIGFLPLAKCLEGFAVYAFNFIQSPNRIQEYADLIAEHHQGEAPVLLGYSSGGNLAYHVARELESRDLEPAMVVMIDSDRRLETAVYEPEEVESVIADFLEDPGIQPYLKSEILRDKIREQVRASFQWYNTTTDHHLINTPIHLILEEGQLHDNTASNHPWREVTSDCLCLYQGSGTHNEMLWEDHLETNVALINSILRDGNLVVEILE